MNRTLFGALLLFATSALASAGTETSESEGWISLDREIENLAATTADNGTSGMTVSGFIRAYYGYSSDYRDRSVDPIGDRYSGFQVPNARLIVEGSHAGYGLLVSAEAGEGYGNAISPNNGPGGVGSSSVLANVGGGLLPSASVVGDGNVGDEGELNDLFILDAYGTAPIGNVATFTIGQFRAPFSQNALTDSDRLAFVNRTILGSMFNARDLGAMLTAAWENLMFWFAWQNGLNGGNERSMWTVRAAFSSSGQMPMTEGSEGTPQDNNFYVAGAFTSDDNRFPSNNGKRQAWITEAGYANGAFGGHFEYGNLYQGYFLNANRNTIQPWAIQADWMATPMWQLAARGQWLQDNDRTEIWSIVVNYYLGGHAAKWQFSWDYVASRLDSIDASVFTAGLVLGVGR